MTVARSARPDDAETSAHWVSLKTLSRLLDAHRSTVRRWLREAGVQPVAMGRGRNGTIRYRGREVRAWLESREQVD